MTSGFSMDVALYDLVTGKQTNKFRGLHQDYINILRFAHRSPHMFATSSFDHTCKVWDLREQIRPTKPVRAFNTQTLNVMCCFSPDDKHVLCSGVDAALLQFNLERSPKKDWTVGMEDPSVGSAFPIPALNRQTNYRRSLYLADGAWVATAATNESLLRFYTADAPHRHQGVIDFRHYLQAARASPTSAPREPLGTGPAIRHHIRQQAQAQRQRDRQREAMMRRRESAQAQATSGDSSVETQEEESEEFVQSLRCHPKDPRLLAVLLSTTDVLPESYVSMINMTS
jgi:hypothetical protein